MRQEQTFSQILQQKIGQEDDFSEEKSTASASSQHWQSQSFDTDPAHIAFLLGEINLTSSRRNKPSLRKNAYPRPPVKPVPPHVLTPDQTLAVEFFSKWGKSLTPAFSKAELKAAFRFLAKRLHPDLSRRSGLEFMELQSAFKCLSEVPKK